MDVQKFLRFHQSRHATNVLANCIDLSYDGVVATNSSSRSFEVLSGKFPNCRMVYPLSVGVSGDGFSDLMKAPQVMKSTLVDLKQSGVYVRFFVMDHPKRCGESTCVQFDCTRVKFYDKYQLVDIDIWDISIETNLNSRVQRTKEQCFILLL